MTEQSRVGMFEAGMRDQGHADPYARELAQAFLMGRRAFQCGREKRAPASFGDEENLRGAWEQGWQETKDGWF